MFQPPALRITEDRTFSVSLGARTVTGLAVASAWEGFTKYTTGPTYLIVDANDRVITGSASLLTQLGLGEPEIGDPFEGGIYAGRTAVDGKPARLVLMPGDVGDVSWDQAAAWAATLGATLPTREEQRILYDNLKSELNPTWYWSNEQHASLPSIAWHQHFFDGLQGYNRKSYEGRARAVRRLPI